MSLHDLLKNRAIKLHELIADSYSEEYTKNFDKFILKDTKLIGQSALKALNDIPRCFGRCVIMSAYLCALLTDEHKLPAVTVAGELIISGIPAFQTDVKIQQPNQPNIILDNWQGHCWVEIGGLICDVSICITADLSPDGSNLKAFVHSRFGKGKGLVAFPIQNALDEGMVYSPEEVLADGIITAIIKSYFSK